MYGNKGFVKIFQQHKRGHLHQQLEQRVKVRQPHLGEAMKQFQQLITRVRMILINFPGIWTHERILLFWHKIFYQCSLKIGDCTVENVCSVQDHVAMAYSNFKLLFNQKLTKTLSANVNNSPIDFSWNCCPLSIKVQHFLYQENSFLLAKFSKWPFVCCD